MRRVLRTALVTVVAGFVGLIALLAHPQPLFAYSLTRGNITLHARTPLPRNAPDVVDDALARIKKSALYDPQLMHHVFLCPSTALYDVFALGQRRSRGVTLDYLNGNIFIGPSSVERNEVYGPSGRAAGLDRPLSYYLAHEITHHMTSSILGRFRYWQLAPWQREGYADYVGRAQPVDLRDEAARFRDGDPRMDPGRSGLYLRYRLEVAFLLEHEHLSVDELFATRRPVADIDRELLTALR